MDPKGIKLRANAIEYLFTYVYQCPTTDKWADLSVIRKICDRLNIFLVWLNHARLHIPKGSKTVRNICSRCLNPPNEKKRRGSIQEYDKYACCIVMTKPENEPTLAANLKMMDTY